MGRGKKEVCDGDFKESGEGRKAPGEMTFEQRLGESGGFGERIFQAEGTASAKALVRLSWHGILF